ncbi:unnamed protein product, partial [Didymodactylos carnosus]
IAEKVLIQRQLDANEALKTNIAFYFEFEGDRISKERVCQAFRLIRQQHPYFRLRVEDGAYVKDEKNELQIIHFDELCPDWQQELVEWANRPRDHSKSLMYLKHHLADTKHQLFGVVNHVGIEGLGFFLLTHTFFDYLSRLIESNDVRVIEERAFINMFSQNPLKETPDIRFEHDYLKPQGKDPDPGQACSTAEKGEMIGTFGKNVTDNLLKSSLQIETTMQGSYFDR